MIAMDGNMLFRLQHDLQLEPPLVERGKASTMRRSVRALQTSMEVLHGFRAAKRGEGGAVVRAVMPNVLRGERKRFRTSR
jgi:hypothetical protein